jgi:hypothetical protein
VRFQTAKTRSSEQAEKLAREEIRLRDPDTIRYHQIEMRDAEKRAGEKAKNITIESACDRWFASQKLPPSATAALHRRAAKRIQSWAKESGLERMVGNTYSTRR